MFGPGFSKFVGPDKAPVVLAVIRHPFTFWTLTISSVCDPSVARSGAVDWRNNAVNGAKSIFLPHVQHTFIRSDPPHDFNREDVGGSEHIGTENDPFHVRRKGDIGLEPVVMLREIDKPLGLEIANVDEIFFIAERTSLHHDRPEQVNPLAVSGRV